MNDFVSILVPALIFFVPPIFSFVVFLISLVRYLKASHNTQKYSEGAVNAIKKTWMISMGFFVAYAMAALEIIMIVVLPLVLKNL